MARDPNVFCKKRFIGNINPDPPIVHDLTLENREPDGCQIDEILVGHIRTFDPDTLKTAKSKGFRPCKKCLESEYIEIEIIKDNTSPKKSL